LPCRSSDHQVTRSINRGPCSVKPINSTRCEYTNSVTATPTEEFLDFIKQHGISFEQAAAARQAAGADHNRRETPLFAESIARKALVRSSAQRQ
jgi:hypothetical protein